MVYHKSGLVDFFFFQMYLHAPRVGPGDVIQFVEYLPRMHEALAQFPEGYKTLVVQACNPSFQGMEGEG